jgi:hypothetical protein
MREYLSKTNTFRKITGILLSYHWLNTASIRTEIVKKKKGFSMAGLWYGWAWQVHELFCKIKSLFK